MRLRPVAVQARGRSRRTLAPGPLDLEFLLRFRRHAGPVGFGVSRLAVVGPDAGKAIVADLAAADAAIEEVGAYAWAPFADEERVRLARLES